MRGNHYKVMKSILTDSHKMSHMWCYAEAHVGVLVLVSRSCLQPGQPRAELDSCAAWSPHALPGGVSWLRTLVSLCVKRCVWSSSQREFELVTVSIPQNLTFGKEGL